MAATGGAIGGLIAAGVFDKKKKKRKFSTKQKVSKAFKDLKKRWKTADWIEIPEEDFDLFRRKILRLIKCMH